MTTELKPAETGERTNNQSLNGERATCTLMPRELKELLISEMTASSAGQDWNYLILALGKSLPETNSEQVKVLTFIQVKSLKSILRCRSRKFCDLFFDVLYTNMHVVINTIH